MTLRLSDNGIAMCGADVDLDTLQIKDLVYVYDNEPRNKEICARIEKAIKQGKKVVIFPSRIIEKDLNDMVLAGHERQFYARIQYIPITYSDYQV